MGVVVGYGGSRRMGERQGEVRDGFGIALGTMLRMAYFL